MTTNAKTCERRNVYIITAALMAVLIILILIFSKNPAAQLSAKDLIIQKISAAQSKITAEDLSVPAGAELLTTIVTDANCDNYFEVYREYKYNDEYIIKCLLTDNGSNITPLSYDLIDNPETQECFLGTEHEFYQPLIIVKETLPDSVTYSVVYATAEGKQTTPLFTEKTVDGVKKYFYHEEDLEPEVYEHLFEHFYCTHFYEAKEILPESSFNII